MAYTVGTMHLLRCDGLECQEVLTMEDGDGLDFAIHALNECWQLDDDGHLCAKCVPIVIAKPA